MPMDDSELITILESEERQSVGYSSSDLTQAQDRGLEYYRGEPFGDEVEGQSQVVSRDVMEVVEWTLPELMRMFISGGKVVEFEPSEEGAEDAADDATQFCNTVFFRDNPGVMLMNDWFKDALIQKVGIIKVYWEETERTEHNSEGAISIDRLTELEGREEDGEVKILKVETRDVPEDLPPEDAVLYTNGVAYDVEYTEVIKTAKIAIEGVPPEEFGVANRTRSLQEARYTRWTRRTTKSEMKLAGFDEDKVDGLSTFTTSGANTFGREAVRFRGQSRSSGNTPSIADPALDEVEISEEYLFVDFDEDGIAELRKVIRSGKTIFENEPVKHNPWCDVCPYPIPHTFYGMSEADITFDIQQIQSTLNRQALDNIYLANRPRLEIPQDAMLDDGTTIDDALTWRSGALLRTKGAGGIKPIVVPDMTTGALGMINYTNAVRARRTGITEARQGVNPDAIHKTATGADLLSQGSNTRIEMIARLFAEGGVSVLFRKILMIARENITEGRSLRIKGKFRRVDPRQWDPDMNILVHVGLGAGNRDRMLQHLLMLLQIQERAASVQMADKSNFYNTAERIVEAMGLTSTELYFIDPATAEPAPPKPDPMEQALMMQRQVAMIQAEVDRMDNEQQAKIDMAQSEQDSTLKIREQDHDARLRLIEMQADFEKERRQLLLEAALRRREIVLKNGAGGVSTQFGGEILA